MIAESLRSIRAWTSVMLRDEKDAGPEPLKDLILKEISDLRAAIEQPSIEASRAPGPEGETP